MRLYTMKDIQDRLGVPRSTLVNWSNRKITEEGYIEPFATTSHGSAHIKLWTAEQLESIATVYANREKLKAEKKAASAERRKAKHKARNIKYQREKQADYKRLKDAEKFILEEEKRLEKLALEILAKKESNG